MNRLSPAHRLLDDPMQSVLGMPTIVYRDISYTTWLVDFSPLRRWLVRGGQAVAWLRECGIDVPDEYFYVQDQGVDSFVVRTGFAELFLHDGAAGLIERRFENFSDRLVRGARIVERDDLEVVLGGEAATRLMSEFCALDLSSSENKFLLTRVAGISAWVRVEKFGIQRYYRIGCDPSYGEYLFETLLDGIEQFEGGVLGHENFYEMRGNQHDAR